MVKLISYFFLIIIIFSQLNVQAKDLLVAGTEWCPYNCVDENRPGIISEYVEFIAKKIDMKAVIELLSWSRAITEVKTEQYDVLMSCGESDSKGLIKSLKLLDYQMCFFTLPTSNWTYNGVESLDSIQLGSIQDYAYGEPLDGYLSTEKTNTSIVKGQNAHERLIQMLDLSRIDSFVADKILTKYLYGKKYREAGCLPSSPLYLGFNEKVDQKIIDKINSEISKNKDHLKEITNKYIPPNE